MHPLQRATRIDVGITAQQHNNNHRQGQSLKDFHCFFVSQLHCIVVVCIATRTSRPSLTLQHHGSPQGTRRVGWTACTSVPTRHTYSCTSTPVSLQSPLSFSFSFPLVLSLDFRTLPQNQSNSFRQCLVTRSRSFVSGFEWYYPWLYASSTFGCE